MSIPVALDELRGAIGRCGGLPFLLTVGADGRPHSVAVLVSWAGDELVVAAGNTSVANARDRPLVSVLWPAVPPAEFSLIVDATVTTATGTGTGDNRVVMAPTRAVLHRSVGPDNASGSASCLPVYQKI